MYPFLNGLYSALDADRPPTITDKLHIISSELSQSAQNYQSSQIHCTFDSVISENRVLRLSQAISPHPPHIFMAQMGQIYLYYRST